LFSRENEVVLDPFCGCGTTVIESEKMGRKWIGIDITPLAVNLIEKRLNDMFVNAKYTVNGIPKDLAGAKKLVESPKGRFLFEQWFVTSLGGQPYKSKGGSDHGIDGFMYFIDTDGKNQKIVISVKSGKIVPSFVRDLAGVVSREKAAIGLLLTLAEPTKNLTSEAASLGLFKMKNTETSYPKIQIFSVTDFFNGRKPVIPDVRGTLKTAQKKIRDSEKPVNLL
jgi:site-specific DNA-methyltransferase (adenine-specific)